MYIHEYKCGCIFHALAGQIRKCEGCTSRTPSGRMIAKPEGAEKRHNEGMSIAPVKTWDVANILP